MIPNSVTSIGENAFYGCSGLTSVVIPNSVTSIWQGAFSGCSSLTSVVIPNSLTYIARHAFSGCSSLTSVVIPNSVTSIRESAFRNCSSLTSVVIPNSVTSIGFYAFLNCYNLKVVFNNSSFTFAKGSSDYGYIAYYAEVVCNGYEQVDDFIFTEEGGACYLRAYIGDKTELVLPANYKGGNYSIGSYAFSGCSNLQSITLGNSVKRIYGSWSHLQLRTIICLNPNAVEIDQGGFSMNTFNHAVVYVPEDSYWNYAYSNWGAFIHIKEMVTQANSLQSRKAYMIADSKGTNFKVYDAERDALKNVEYTHALDEESEDCCWTVMKENGKTYLFNLGAKKFGVVGDNGAITLSETPVHVAISETEGGLSINGNNCMFVLNKHVEVDATGISDVLLNGQDAKNAQIHSLDGRPQQTLKRGVNIVNGKKVFVQ